MSDEFHKTRMGMRFYEHEVPRIADALVKIAEAMSKPAGVRHDMGRDAKPEPRIIEMVWVVTNVDKVVAKDPTAILAFATERAACDYVHDEINETLGLSTLRDSHLARLEEWRNAETKKSELIVAAFTIRCLVVQL